MASKQVRSFEREDEDMAPGSAQGTWPAALRADFYNGGRFQPYVKHVVVDEVIVKGPAISYPHPITSLPPVGGPYPIDPLPEPPVGGPYPIDPLPEPPVGGPYPLDPLPEGGVGVHLPDPGFVVYIDKDGNIVCGYPPEGYAGPIKYPPIPEPAEPAPPIDEVNPAGFEPGPSAPLTPAPADIYGEGESIFLGDGGFTVYIDENGNAVCGTPPSGYGGGGISTHLLLDDGGFTVYIDAEGNAVCGIPPEGYSEPPVACFMPPLTAGDDRGAGLFPAVITDPANDVQNAIDAFVISTGAESKVPAHTLPVEPPTDYPLYVAVCPAFETPATDAA